MKAILLVDIPDDKNINNIEIDYYVYNIKNHDIPFGKELLKVGGVMKPKILPKQKIFRQDKRIYDYDNGYVNGWNDCLEEMEGA